MTSRRIAIVVAIHVCIVPLATALDCYTCDTRNSQPCDGKITTCPADNVCRTEVRDENNIYSIVKMCKESTACDPSAADCLSGSGILNCIFCCSTSLCNNQFPTEIPSTVEASKSEHGKSTAVNAVTTAVNAATTAGNAVTTAGNAATTAGNAVTTAGNAVTTAGNAVTTPENAMTTPGNAVTTAGNAATTAGNAVTTAGNAATTVPSVSATKCNHAWRSRSSTYKLVAANHTVQAAYSTATFLASSTVNCAVYCGGLHNNCEFFAFDQLQRKCFIGDDSYDESKLQISAQANVFQRF